MRETIVGLAVVLFGLLTPLWLDRVMSGAPDWVWRLAAWLCVCLGLFIACASDLVYSRLRGPAFSPLVSTLVVSVLGAVVAGTGWWFAGVSPRAVAPHATTHPPVQIYMEYTLANGAPP